MSSPGAIQLIAFDLDGTFLADDRSCVPANIEAVARAAARGIHIVPCTGRMFSGMPEEIRALPFVRYGITMNGADLYDRETDSHILETPLRGEAAEAVFNFLDTLPVIYDCFLDGMGWIDRKSAELWPVFVEREPVRRTMERTRRQVDGFRDFVRQSGSPVQKITALFRDQQLRLRTMEDLRCRFPGLAVTSSIYNNVEINDGKANKGAGLLALCTHLRIDPAHAMTLGDASNDISMLQAAGVGVAMANAQEEVKAAADYVTERDNNGGGVAEAINRFALMA